jgi:hypothetical protein
MNESFVTKNTDKLAASQAACLVASGVLLFETFVCGGVLPIDNLKSNSSRFHIPTGELLAPMTFPDERHILPFHVEGVFRATEPGIPFQR